MGGVLRHECARERECVWAILYHPQVLSRRAPRHIASSSKLSQAPLSHSLPPTADHQLPRHSCRHTLQRPTPTPTRPVPPLCAAMLLRDLFVCVCDCLFTIGRSDILYDDCCSTSGSLGSFPENPTTPRKGSGWPLLARCILTNERDALCQMDVLHVVWVDQ